MQLSQQAKKKLQKILIEQHGERAEFFSDEYLNNFGLRLLKITATIMKRKMSCNS